MFFLKRFIDNDENLFVSEFGHSVRGKIMTVGPRSREIYLLHIVIQGSCQFSGFEVQAGQAFFISKGHRHSFSISEDYEHFWIGFSGKQVVELLSIFGMDSNKHHLFHLKNFDYIKALLCAAADVFRDEKIESMKSYSLSLLTAPFPLLEINKQSVSKYQTDYAEKISMYIDVNYIYPIKLYEIAKEIHLSEKYMYRLFVDAFGISPQKYLIKKRMESARSMIMKNYPIKVIAYSVGYSSVAAFSKAFTNYYGTSPRSMKQKEVQ